MDRRRFLRAAGGSLLAAGAALGASCDFTNDDEPTSGTTKLFATAFSGTGEGWGEPWINVSYLSRWERRGRGGVLNVPPGERKAVTEGRPQIEYMTQPVIVRDIEAGNASVSARIVIEGKVEAGVIACWSYDEAYALVARAGRAFLYRYATGDRSTLAEKRLHSAGPLFDVVLTVADQGRLSGRITSHERTYEIDAEDPTPLPRGHVGVIANPTDDVHGGRVRVENFSVASPDESTRAHPRFAYRFTGGIVPDEGGYKAHLTARTVVPDEVAFELADNAGFTGARRVGPVATTGRLGAAHTWFEGLEPDTLYFWRPKAGDIGGPVASFRTPPAPGRPVRFVFSSCTTGRVAAYPSFRTALGLKPAFYLHAGDWGYADFNSIARRADHFQTRWTRLLRIPEVAGLLDATPLMFWQDDHDYYSDNGWSKTIPAFAVEAFDEMHANPTSEYFDVRWGDVHAWCLDCRLYATNPKGIDGPGKSRLGAEQKAWLIDGMRTSDAPVRIVASAMAFRNKIDDDPGWHNKYTYERDELLSFFSDLDATVLILSGDSHGQRLIHHFEFGELYEVTSSGTDFPGHSGQGNNDPEHTLVNIDDSNGIAFVELDAAGPGRELTVRCIASESGEVLFEKSLPVSA